MKKYIHIAAALLLSYSAVSCREEVFMTADGEGILSLHTTINSEVKVVSRAITPEQEQALAESVKISIYKNNGNKSDLLYHYIGASTVPSSLRLLSGNYYSEAWVGDSVPASWDKTYYWSDFQYFSITAGQNTDLTLNCKIRNTLASVSYTEGALENLSSPVMTISLDDGITDGSHSLTFDEPNSGAKGRFMINSRTKGLTWTLTGTQKDGSEFTKSGVIEDIKHATEYRLKVDYASHNIEVGGAFFDIEIEEEPVGDDSQIEVLLPPNIVGMLGFDNNSFSGEEGKIGRKSIYISAAAALSDAEITSDLFTPIVGVSRVDLINIQSAPAQSLNDAGLTWQYYYDEDTDMSALRINLEEELTNTLTEGEYTFNIMAKDVHNKVSNAIFTISITNAPLVPLPIPQSSVSYTSATLEATVLKEASEYGYEIREVNASRAYEDWTRVPGEVSDNKVTVIFSNLRGGTNYEARAYADDYVAEEIISFATPAYPQLENSGFEDWYNGGVTPSNDSKGWFPISNPANIYWDCGNHGSLTLGNNITNRSSEVKHSDSYSIEMKSQFVGLFGIGKFAAGNVFYGKYLKTDDTDGELGFGRPFPNIRPKALKGWVKYRPTAISDKKEYQALPEGAELKQNDLDQGIIYIALLSDDLTTQGDGSQYPVLVKTKKQSDGKPKLFNSSASNVIAYGEVIFNETSGEEMVPFTIDIKDVNAGQDIAYIMVVCSASRYGDYFAGGRGSTMWIDDLELVY